MSSQGSGVGQRLAYSYGSLGTGTVVYAYHDQLGSTRRWRLNKSNWGANEYEPYGEAYAVSTLAPRDYALHEWDPAIAAYRAPHRNYSPSMARWMTRDPLGMVDGPNMYGYVGGNPISKYDYLGDSYKSCVDKCYRDFSPRCVEDACQAVCAIAMVSCMFGPNPVCVTTTAACAACTMFWLAKAAACRLNCLTGGHKE